MRRALITLALILAASAVSRARAQPVVDAGVDGSTDAAVDAATDAGPSVPHLDLENPRAAVRSFVVAMQLAADDRPELIDEAVRCLDVDWLEGAPNAESRSRQLAAQLFEALADLDIILEEITESAEGESAVLRELPAVEGQADALSVSLALSDEGWRFSRETLEHLSAIREALERLRSEDDVNHNVHAAVRSPRATMRTFLEAMDEDPPNVDRAADCLAPPSDANAAWAVERHDHAYRLYNVLLRVRAPVLSTIPEHPQGRRYTWYVHERGRVVLERVEEDDPEAGIWHGEWRFSQSTLASIEELYEVHAYGPVLPEVTELGYVERLSRGLSVERTMPEALRAEALGLAIWKWFGIAFLLMLAVLVFGLGELTFRLVYAPVNRIWHIETDTVDVERASRAVGWLAMFYTLHRFIAANTLLLPTDPLAFLHPFMQTMVFVAGALFALRVVQIAEDHYQRSERMKAVRLANLVLPLFESFFRLVIGAILIAFVLRLLGFSQAAVLGGLGLFGAAVGFAARESLANAVAAISIVYDRPFRVGDWVNLDGVDATVERLGLVSVRLRTFYNSLLVVPNTEIVTKSVDNYGERRYRRLRHFLRLRYDTPSEKIDALCEALRELVLSGPHTRKDYFHIYLNQLTPSSADVMIYVFFEVPDWSAELRERHRFLIDALALVEELGIELAYPTQRLLVEEVSEEPDE